MKGFWFVGGLALVLGCNEHPVELFAAQVEGERRDVVHSERPKVDVLWVVDNSSSMEEEQARLRENFALFIDEMAAADADFHLAVTTTEMDPFETSRALSPQQGRFQNVPDGRPSPNGVGGVDVGHCVDHPLVLRSGDYRDEAGRLDTASLRRDFGCSATVGLNGSGFEQGLEAALVALSPPLIDTHNAGFLRDDAHLAIVFVTDENDCSDRGAIERKNGNECEWEAESLVPVAEYARAYRALKRPDRKVVVAGIFAPDTGFRAAAGQAIPAACDASTGVAYSGWRYDQLVHEMGGVTASICQPLFTRALEEVAGAVGDALRETCLTDRPRCAEGEDCVRVELHRQDSSGELAGADCEARAGGGTVCTLTAGEHYSIDYGADCGISITLAVETSPGDRAVARYPQ